MSEASKAVFLSYASQDAEAAKKICDALRGAGIEVWFDQNELVGGDAWDAKIRRQIAECGLFLPIISANTEARLEGYFRLEWKLAANRTHTMADEKPFLLPIVIDGTRDAGAKVPAEFRAVQWTRLRPAGFGGQARIGSADSLDAFCERVRVLLAGEVAPVSDRRPGKVETNFAGQRPALPSRRWVVPTFIGAAIVFALAIIQPWRNGPSAAPRSATAAQTPLTEADQLVARGYAILDNFHYRRDDLAVAEDFLRRATEQAPGSARAWAARAYVNSLYLLRGWDREEKRRQDTQTFANRALALNANDTDAMLALAYLFNLQGAFVQTEALMRKAMGLRTDDSRLPRSLGAALRGQQRLDESIATLQDGARRFPRDPLVRYELGLSYLIRPDRDAAFAEFEAALAIQPFASALLQKAAYLANIKGDLPGARATLDQIEPFDRTEDRAVGASMWVGLLERSSERVMAAAALTARAYLEDSNSLFTHGPKAITLALVHQVTGKEAVAHRHWQEAETLLRQRLREQPNDLDAHARLAICLARLGRQDEADLVATRVESILREQRVGPRMLMAYYYAGRGDAAKAMAHALDPLTRRSSFNDTLSVLNPWFDPIRGQPEFERAVAEATERRIGGAGQNGGRAVGSPAANSEPRTPPALRSRGEGGNSEPSNPAQPDSKSVVVLPFANLSGDPEQEYFSDGLTEEILNALARERDLRVPGRASAFSFKGKGASVAEIAKALNVAQLVEGSVRKAGNRVRITVQLTRASDGFSEALPTVERELTDIFALQDEVARLVVEKLTRRTSTTAPVAVLTKVPEAYDAYLKGRALQTKAAGFRYQAAALYERAVTLDPNFALAWARLAEARFRDYRAYFDWRPSIVESTWAALEEALAANPDLAEALIVRGSWQRLIKADYAAAERDFAQAELLQAPTGELRHAQALLAFDRGQIALAKQRLHEAIRLDPENGDLANSGANTFSHLDEFLIADELYTRGIRIQSPGGSIVLWNRVMLRARWRGPAAALHLVERAPETIKSHELAAAMLLQLGRKAEALDRARQTRIDGLTREDFAVFQDAPDAAEVLDAAGDSARARVLWQRLQSWGQQEISAGNLAPRIRESVVRAEMALGNREAAGAALEAWRGDASRITSVEQRIWFCRLAAPCFAKLGMLDDALALLQELENSTFTLGMSLQHDPRYANLRGDARFQSVVARAEARAKAQPDPVGP